MFRVMIKVKPKRVPDGGDKGQVSRHNPTVKGFCLEHGKEYSEFVRTVKKGRGLVKERHPASPEFCAKLLKWADEKWPDPDDLGKFQTGIVEIVRLDGQAAADEPKASGKGKSKSNGEPPPADA